MVQVQGIANPPRSKVVGAGLIAANAQTSDFLAAANIQRKPTAKNVHTADPLANQWIERGAKQPHVTLVSDFTDAATGRYDSGGVISRSGPVTPEADCDYFAAETYYRSLANRIVAALRAGGGFILITGHPPEGPHLLSQALRKSTQSP
jgi:hypothetical protein